MDKKYVHKVFILVNVPILPIKIRKDVSSTLGPPVSTTAFDDTAFVNTGDTVFGKDITDDETDDALTFDDGCEGNGGHIGDDDDDATVATGRE